MLSRLFEHCILTRYSDVIHVNCYDKFEKAMVKLYEDNVCNEFDNHVKYVNMFRFHPPIIKKYIYNREFDIPYKNENKSTSFVNT